MLIQTFMHFFILLNTKEDILKNVVTDLVSIDKKQQQWETHDPPIREVSECRTLKSVTHTQMYLY